jgi:hypothetical protein
MVVEMKGPQKMVIWQPDQRQGAQNPGYMAHLNKNRSNLAYFF